MSVYDRPPTFCPACGGRMRWHEWLATRRCTNPHCPAFDRWSKERHESPTSKQEGSPTP